MMSKVPVVACEFPEIKKVVIEDQIGLVVDSHNPSEIANAVNELLENKELHSMFRENCTTAREKYNWNNEKEIFVKIYDDLFYKKDVVQDGINIEV